MDFDQRFTGYSGCIHERELSVVATEQRIRDALRVVPWGLRSGTVPGGEVFWFRDNFTQFELSNDSTHSLLRL